MKILLSLLLLLAISNTSFAQSTYEGRTAVSYISNFLDEDLIKAMDGDALTPKEEKKYIEWKKRLKHATYDRMINKCSAVLKEKNMELLAKDAVAPFGFSAVTVDGYPSISFPKKALKKKGEKLNVADYFISISLSTSKPLMPNPLKGYYPINEVTIKLFSKKGELLKKATQKMDSEVLLGKVSLKTEKEFFSKIDFESIDTYMEKFGADIDKVVAAAMKEVYE